MPRNTHALFVVVLVSLFACSPFSRAQIITTTVTAGTFPAAVAVNSATNKIYVANGGSDDVTVIDGATDGTITVPTGIGPIAVAVNLF